MFCIPNPAGIYLDGGTIEYFGLGYKVIDFNRLSGYDEVKVGTWFMDYKMEVRGIEPRASTMLKSHSTTEPHSLIY